MDLTVRQMETLEYRKQRLRDAARELEPLLSGGNASLPPRVRTEAGRYSEKRAWALVEALLAALEKYERYCVYREDGNPVLAELPYRLPERRRAFYRSFLYCAVRIADSRPYWFCRTKGAFGDLLALAEQAGYSDPADLYFDELYNRPKMDGLFACMDSLYELLSGEKIEAAIPEEGRQAVFRRHQAEIEEREAALAEFPDLSPEEQAEADQAWYDSLSSEEKQAADQEAEEYLQEERDQQAWAGAFQEKEVFCRQYLLFRKLYFEEAAWHDLARNVEHTLDIYLCEQGASALLEDGTFFYAYTLLTKVLRQVRRLGQAEAD